MNHVIQPAVGRHVHFVPVTAGVGLETDRPHAAIVAHVHHDRLVNLTVFDKNGVPVPRTSVTLQQPGDAEPVGDYCRWMPYTVGRSVEQLESSLAAFDAATPAPA